MNKSLKACFMVFLTILTTSAVADALRFSFSDDRNDWYAILVGQTQDPIDLTGMEFTFDNNSGAYSIQYTSDSDHPFVGYFRLNTNLYNTDITPSTVDPSFFSDTARDFTLSTPTTSIVITGINPKLLSWHEGDRVAATDSMGLPSDATFTGFHSGVNAPGGWFTVPQTVPTYQDRLSGVAPIEAVVINPVSITEPTILTLFGVGFVLLGIGRRYGFQKSPFV